MDFNDFDDFDNVSTPKTNKKNQNHKTVKNNKSFDIMTLIVSLIGGIVGYFISNIVYNIVSNHLWSPLAIGLRYMIFMIILGLFVFIYSMINGNQSLSQNGVGKNIVFFILAIILTLLVSTLFEFIYEINLFSEDLVYNEPTSYVFIIDNSGSMTSSDPNGLRYDAIDKIIENKDDSFPYAIYSFNSSVKCEREVAPKSQGKTNLETVNSGGTKIKATLEELIDDYENGKMKGLGASPKFLLLSDGYASDIGLFSSISKTLQNYVKNNITISTVGLGRVDEDLMQNIADKTGGVFISVEQADQLENAMSSAISQTSNDQYNRTFFTYREVPSLDLLYAIMRIVFTALIGFVVSFSMLFATGKDDDTDIIFISSLITSVIAGLLLELGINAFNLPTNTITLLYMIIIASTFIHNYSSQIIVNDGNKYQSERYQSQNNKQIQEQKKKTSFEDKSIGF
jgi:hypothetical protein